MSVWSVPKRRSYRPGSFHKVYAFFALFAVFCVFFSVYSLSPRVLPSVFQKSFSGAAPVEASSLLTTVDILDVGQGSAALIRFPDGKTMIVDSGPPSSRKNMLSYLKQRNIETVDCMVITHQHGDHAGNVSAVLSACTVKDIVFPAAPVNLLIDPERYEGINKDIDDYGLVIHNPEKGEVLMSGEGYSVTVLSDDSGDYEALNDYSIILRVVAGDVSFLMMADAESFIEQQLLHSGTNLNSDVLLVGHHGNRNAVSIPFLQAVTPSAAVISVGENKFGQPSNAVISRLTDSNIPFYRTDDEGTVTFETDGSTYQVFTSELLSK